MSDIKITGHHRWSHNGPCEPGCYYETYKEETSSQCPKFPKGEAMTETIWIMEKRYLHERQWEVCSGCWLAGAEKEMKAQAKRFTEESVGWVYRSVPFDRRKR